MESQEWEQRSQEAARAITRWQQAHPQATLADIETAVDEQMNELRARMIEDVAEKSASRQEQVNTRTCPECGERMHSRGKRARRLQTQGGQQVTVKREYQSCPACGYSFFPPR